MSRSAFFSQTSHHVGPSSSHDAEHQHGQQQPTDSISGSPRPGNIGIGLMFVIRHHYCFRPAQASANRMPVCPIGKQAMPRREARARGKVNLLQRRCFLGIKAHSIPGPPHQTQCRSMHGRLSRGLFTPNCSSPNRRLALFDCWRACDLGVSLSVSTSRWTALKDYCHIVKTSMELGFAVHYK